MSLAASSPSTSRDALTAARAANQILVLGKDMRPASVLWLRRQLDGLKDSLAHVVTEVPWPSGTAEGADGVPHPVPLKRGWTLPAWRAARRLGMIHRLPATRRAERHLLSLLERQNTGAVLVHYATVAVKYRKVWQRTNKPIFVHCHGYDVTWDLRLPHPPHQAAHPPRYQEQVRNLPENVRFIANSHHTASRLEKIQIPSDRIVVKHLGVPVPQEPPRREARETLKLLYLGRLIDCKGPLELIRAFELARSRGLVAELCIAGDGPLREACASVAAASAFAKDIHLLGEVDAQQGESLRAAADLFTMHHQRGPASRQEEAFGVSIVEAMAAGLPIVSGRSGSLPEIVRHKVDGLLFRPGDIEAHADALLALARDRARRLAMGQSAWLQARREFTIEREISVLRRILGLSG